MAKKPAGGGKPPSKPPPKPPAKPPAKKQSSSETSSLAAKVLGGKPATAAEARKLAASVLSQDEKKGQSKKK